MATLLIAPAPDSRTLRTAPVVMNRRLHLKLFYLRTRKKREPQGVTAKALGVRPATMSHLEQGRSLPTLPMLLALCQHYDVTPNYLLDDARPIEPQVCDLWSQREAIYAQGDWVEVPESAVVRTADDAWLCPIVNGARKFTSGQQAQRLLCLSRTEADRLDQTLRSADEVRDRDLEQHLEKELLGQRKPRSGRRAPVERDGQDVVLNDG